uniref:RNase III domain-containing protein n=1 Tax=Kalanchoe fedtschenkoi TaxID=63787 RepID=A0A7N0VGH0_KALFE
MRSKTVSNSNLYELAIKKNLQVYIRDQLFDPSQFYALGRPCSVICNEETQSKIHSRPKSDQPDSSEVEVDVRCSRGHHWLFKKTIADVVEALVGAFVIDSGFKGAVSFLRWIGIDADYDVSQVDAICIQSKRYLQLNDLIDLASLEKTLDYKFVHKGLLVQAFLHPSYNKHGGGCYQRLEYLGDAVLDYLIISYLYSVYPNMKPGQITDLRSLCVNNKAFADVSISRSFHKFIINDSNSLPKAVEKYVKFREVSNPEECMQDEPKFPKVLGDLMESCIGAVYLDTGFDLKYVWRMMHSLLEPVMRFSSFQISPVRELKELCQCHKWKVEFNTTKVGNIFSVEAVVTGKNISAATCVANHSQKDGIRNAAQEVCMRLKTLLMRFWYPL